MTTSVLVPIQSANYTGWLCAIDALYAKGCGPFTYSLLITPLTSGSNSGGAITINQAESPVFNISVSPTSNS